MKQTIIAGIAALASVALLSSCDDFGATGNKGQGRIVPLIGVDCNVMGAGASKVSARADGEAASPTLSANDLSVKLVKTEGDYAQTWATLQEFQDYCQSQSFPVGTYTLSAFYGDLESTGFDAEAYYGETQIGIRDNMTTEVGLTASMAKSMFSIAYTEAFEKYMTDYTVDVAGIAIAKGVSAPVYVLPGQVAVKITFTTVAGQTATTTVATVDAKARHHYKVTVDVNGGEVGDAALNVDFSDDLTVEPVEIVLSGLFDTAEPAISAVEFDATAPIEFVEGFGIESPLKVNVVAMGGLKSVLLETTSVSLQAQGWPESAELLNASADMQSTLTSLGIKALGLWKNPDKMAQIDFAGVTSAIRVNTTDNTSLFRLTAADVYGRSASFELTMKAEGLQFVLDPEENATYLPGEDCTVALTFNGRNAKDNIKLEYYHTVHHVWETVADWTVEPTGIANNYTITVHGMTQEENLELRATCKGIVSQCVAKAPRYVLTTTTENTFATFAYLSVKDLEAARSGGVGALTYSVKAAGESAYKTVTAEAVGDYVKILGLTPNTTYQVMATDGTDNSQAKVITTESTQQLPNSGFDTWTSEKKGDYQYLWSTSDWGTQNELTCSQSGSGHGSAAITGGCAYKATSGTIPANSRSTKSQTWGGLVGTSNSGDGHTTGNATLHTDKQHTGANAALIRTVGWGKNNKAAAGTKDKEGGFSTCDNMTAGELYFGSLTSENTLTGKNFNCRPSALSFYYQYIVVNTGNGDYGTVEIKVYDAQGNVISSAQKNLTEQNSYTLVTLPLNYMPGVGKAAAVSVQFKSSANPVALTKDTNYWHTPGCNNTSGGEYSGSELYIDDIELIY